MIIQEFLNVLVLNCNDIIPEEARSCLAKTVIIYSSKCKVISLNLLYNYFEMLHKHLSTIPTGIQTPIF